MHEVQQQCIGYCLLSQIYEVKETKFGYFDLQLECNMAPRQRLRYRYLLNTLESITSVSLQEYINHEIVDESTLPNDASSLVDHIHMNKPVPMS